MKTKLYALTLLILAYITGYGQEIISEFSSQNGKMFSNTDIMECSDGTLLTGVSYYSDDYDDYGLLVCKTSPDGQLINSETFNYGTLFSISGAPDRFVISSFSWDDATNAEIFQMTFIDADLNIIETQSIPIFSDVNPQQISIDELIFTPEDDFLISYWTDLELHDYWADYGVFHLMRVRLDGTIVTESETDRIIPPNWSTSHTADSTLTYYSQGFGIFEESPRVYYKVGGYIGTNNDHPWPLIAYRFDENLILTDTIVYKYLDEDTFYDWTGHEHFVPFEKNASTKTYLFAAQIHYPDNVFKASLVKYDMENNPLIIKSVESSTSIGKPVKTIVVDENTIYHAYQAYHGSKNAVILVRLDNGLNNLWNLVLSGGQSNYAYGQCLKALHNGDVAIAFYTPDEINGDHLHLNIIHDSYDSTIESVKHERPFTFYPSPVKDLLNLSFFNENEPESITLYDMYGRLVITKCNHFEHIDMEMLPTGVYMLYITMKDRTSYHEKILKE